MDLVNIIYRYVNHFINSEELITLLENIDKEKFSAEEEEEINRLLEDVKKIFKTIPNKIDVVEVKRLGNIDRMLEAFEKILNSDNLDEKGKEFLEKQYKNMLKDKEKVRDSGPRYKKMFELLTHFSLYSTYCLQMNDLELLEFITQYISVPLPPNISQEAFDELVKVGIKEDKREALWRMAMNYNKKGKNYSKIEDYFILQRDNYYLMELVCGVVEDLDLVKLVDKIVETKDKEFIKKILECDYYTFEDKLEEKLRNAIK